MPTGCSCCAPTTGRQIEVTADTLADAEKGLDRLDALARRFSLPDLLAEAPAGVVAGRRTGDGRGPEGCSPSSGGTWTTTSTRPGALAGLFETVTRAHACADAGDERHRRCPGPHVGVLLAALGLPLAPGDRAVDAETRRLADARDEARTARDWARADALRDELVAQGWIVEDGPDGTSLRR